MKNKHLLLIFICTLLLGLLAKYSPWFKSEIFQADLIRVDPADLQRLSITQAGNPELLLERSDEGWVASQEDFAVRTADSILAPLLLAIAQIRSLRIIHSDRRDTLLLLPTQAIHVAIYLKNGQKETFEIGREVLENKQPATFIEIDRHEGIYLTNQYLRRIFTRSIDDFRSKTVLAFSPTPLQSVCILRPGIDTVFFQKSDTSLLWQSSHSAQMIPVMALKKWLGYCQRLNSLPFATHLEEMQTADNLLLTLMFYTPDTAEPMILKVFGLMGNTLGDDSTVNVPTASKKPLFVLQSSQNRYNFFALKDTLLLQKICSGPGG